MLQQLVIDNVAVIEHTEIAFHDGFNVLTGETGAGKSIVVDALGAVLGARTSRELVRTGTDKAVITASFTGEEAATWCQENDIDAEDGLLLQRRITVDGKSSCRVNGTPVSVQQLRVLGGYLLDIHGQNDGRQLLDESRHMAYLDRFGENEQALAYFQDAYQDFVKTKKEIEQLTMDESEKQRLMETLTHQIREIEHAQLEEGEEEELTERRDLMRNAGQLTEALQDAHISLYGSDEDEGALDLLSEAESMMQKASHWSDQLQAPLETLIEARINLQDVSETLSDIISSLDFSPEEYNEAEQRLQKIRRITKKYNRDVPELLAYLDESKKRLAEIRYAGERIHELKLQLKQQRQVARERAAVLTKARVEAAERLATRIISELRYLSMPSVQFVAEIVPVDNADGFTSTGADEVRFLMSANAGETPGRISRIASGGELSRIMLAMKCVFAEKDIVHSLVFDEIDTGVSGIAAQRVGEKIAELCQYKQVLCITHLPQIAAIADSHFLIRKAERDGRTYTSVTPLDEDGRTRELARLHGGDVITQLSLESAREQLRSAEAYKAQLAAPETPELKPESAPEPESDPESKPESESEPKADVADTAP